MLRLTVSTGRNSINSVSWAHLWAEKSKFNKWKIYTSSPQRKIDMTSHYVKHLLGCPDLCISSPLKLCMYLTNHNKLFYTSLPVTGFVFVIFFPGQVQFQTETDETCGEGWYIISQWPWNTQQCFHTRGSCYLEHEGPVGKDCCEHGLLHLKISRSFTEPQGTDFCVEDDLL